LADRAYQTIHSPRLDLVWQSPAAIEAALEGRADASRLAGVPLPPGWPDEHGRRLLEMRLGQMASAAGDAPWLLRYILLRDEGRVAGYINFHAQPDARGRAELGYTVFEPYRRRGIASEAAQAMMSWAAELHGVRRFVVSIAPDNAPSLALAAKLGFQRTGSQIDEVDGEEYVFELELPSPA
jgi:RimJ/RimL family protein N-acetyltransferase